MISVIIPAFNEERFLPETLRHLRRAVEYAEDPSQDVEILVIDNASTDRTAKIAAELGARVVSVPEHNIGRVRNAGASAASGDLLVFLDADTLIPPNLLSRIKRVMDDPNCLGGAVDTDHRPARIMIRASLRVWRVIGLTLGMAQGALQFSRRDAFTAVKGYDEGIYMGEDVDFYWRLARFAKAQGKHVQFVRDVRVVPSARRFDQWSTWRILIKTSPIYVSLFGHRRAAWGGWYSDVPR